MGTLYVVATPIGNLEDITIRAIKTLLTVPVIACEDTRHTGILINLLQRKYSSFFDPTTPLPPPSLKAGGGVKRKFTSVRDWNEAKMVNKVLEKLGEGDVALVSDAGTPLLSDPGYKIVRAAREAGFKVSPIPGASAVTAALSAAGLPTNKFMFWGFLPKKWSLLPGMTHVIYENPVRLPRLLKALEERYPGAEIVLAREMTKIHEEFVRDSSTKGEVTVLVYLPE